jgi:hypothetical protein
MFNNAFDKMLLFVELNGVYDSDKPFPKTPNQKQINILYQY